MASPPPGVQEEAEPCSQPDWVVPDICPSIAFALADAADGTHIRVLPGHVEELLVPLIIDCAVFIEGPEDGSAQLVGSEGIVVNAGKSKKAVVLRNLNLCIEGGVALMIAGGCSVESCVIEAASVGVEIAAHAGQAVSLERSIVQRCRTGVSLAGSTTIHLEGSSIEHCASGVCVTGLQIEEGWNQILGRLSKASFVDNSGADLVLRSWSIKESSTEVIRHAILGEEVEVGGWPSDSCSVVARTDSGAVVLHFSGGNVNATIFEEEEGGVEENSPTGLHCCSFSEGDGEELPMQTNVDP